MMSATVWQPDALSAGVCIIARVQSVLPSWILCYTESAVSWGCTIADKGFCSMLCKALLHDCSPAVHAHESLQLSDIFCVCTSVARSVCGAGVYGSWPLWVFVPGLGIGKHSLHAKLYFPRDDL